jgi:hypothetical protein
VHPIVHIIMAAPVFRLGRGWRVAVAGSGGIRPGARMDAPGAWGQGHRCAGLGDLTAPVGVACAAMPAGSRTSAPARAGNSRFRAVKRPAPHAKNRRTGPIRGGKRGGRVSAPGGPGQSRYSTNSAVPGNCLERAVRRVKGLANTSRTPARAGHRGKRAAAGQGCRSAWVPTFFLKVRASSGLGAPGAGLRGLVREYINHM